MKNGTYRSIPPWNKPASWRRCVRRRRPPRRRCGCRRRRPGVDVVAVPPVRRCGRRPPGRRRGRRSAGPHHPHDGPGAHPRRGGRRVTAPVNGALSRAAAVVPRRSGVVSPSSPRPSTVRSAGTPPWSLGGRDSRSSSRSLRLPEVLESSTAGFSGVSGEKNGGDWGIFQSGSVRLT